MVGSDLFPTKKKFLFGDMLVFRGVKPHREVLGWMLHDLSKKNGVGTGEGLMSDADAKLPQAIKKWWEEGGCHL